MKSRPLTQSEINKISVWFEKNRPAHPKRRLEKEMIKTRNLMLKLALMALLNFGVQSAHAFPVFPIYGYVATVKAASGLSAPSIPPAQKKVSVQKFTFDDCEKAREVAILDLNAMFPFSVYDKGVCEYVIIGWIELPDTKPPYIDLGWPFLIDENIDKIYPVNKNHVKRLMVKYNIRGYNEALQELNHEFDIDGFESELQREIKATGR